MHDGTLPTPPRAVRRGARATALAALTLALALSACSKSSPKKDTEPSESPSAPDSAQVELPTDAGAFDAEAAVRIADGGAYRAIVSDDLLLTMTGDGAIGYALPDAEEAYTVPPAGGLPADLWADPDNGTGYLLSVESTPGSGTGVGHDQVRVSRFDLATGEVDATVKTRLARPAVGQSRGATARVRGVVDDVAVVDFWLTVDNQRVHTALGLDLGSGSAAWRHRGAALTTTPRTALVSTGTTAAAGSVLALDVSTGKTRWTALAGVRDAALVGLTDRSAVIAWTGPFLSRKLSAIAAGSGRVTSERRADSSAYVCRPADDTTAVCLLPEGRLVAWDLDRNKQLWALPTKTRVAPRVTCVADGLVYGSVAGQWVVLDARTGEDSDSGAGPAPIAVGDLGGLFAVGGGLFWLPALTAPEPEESPSDSPSDDGSESPSDSESSTTSSTTDTASPSESAAADDTASSTDSASG